jgi:hypothetical protein
VLEVQKLLSTFRGERVSVPVRKALVACAENAQGLERARAKVQSAQVIYSRAIEARDALLQRWTTSLARLKRRAGEVWSDAPETVAHIFASLDDEPRSEILDLRPVLPTVMNGVHTS